MEIQHVISVIVIGIVLAVLVIQTVRAVRSKDEELVEESRIISTYAAIFTVCFYAIYQNFFAVEMKGLFIGLFLVLGLISLFFIWKLKEFRKLFMHHSIAAASVMFLIYFVVPHIR